MTNEESIDSPLHRFERAGLGKAPFYCTGNSESFFQAHPGAPKQPDSSCDFCGTGIIQVFHIKSSDNHQFKVGCECVNKTGDAGLIKQVKEIKAQVKRAKRDVKFQAEHEARKAATKVKTDTDRAATLAANPWLIEAFKLANPILQDLAGGFAKWGKLSERQLELARKLMSQEAERATEIKVSAPIGRHTVVGTIIKVKSVEGFGYNAAPVWKMTVMVKNGNNVWMCWGSIPREIIDAAIAKFGYGVWQDGLCKMHVQFDATLEVSQTSADGSFAFFKRPTKASLL